jgi:integrase
VTPRAVRFRALTSSPFAPRGPQARNKTDARRLTDEECAALIEHALPSSRALVALIVFTGLRQGEALGLTWQEVDFEQGVIGVRFQLERKAKDTTARRTRLKTTAARRDVEALPELIALLKTHKAEAFARGHARPEDFVFTTANGLPLMHRNVSRDFATAASLDSASASASGDVAPPTRLDLPLSHSPSMGSCRWR